MDLGLFTDAMGHPILGADLDIPANGQGAANAPLVVTTAVGLKRRILYATFSFSGAVTLTCTVFLISGLGAAWNTQLAAVVFNNQTTALWTPPHAEFLITPTDQIQATAPAGGVGIAAAIAIYNEVVGASTRAVDATS